MFFDIITQSFRTILNKKKISDVRVQKWGSNFSSHTCEEFASKLENIFRVHSLILTTKRKYLANGLLRITHKEIFFGLKSINYTSVSKVSKENETLEKYSTKIYTAYFRGVVFFVVKLCSGPNSRMLRGFGLLFFIIRNLKIALDSFYPRGFFW